MLGAEKQIVDSYVAEGQVKIVFWPILDLGPSSLNGAVAASCAGQQNPDLFWQLHDAYFENQGQLFRADRAYFVETAVAAGAERSAFETCYDGGEMAATIQQLDDARRRLGIRNRPSFDVNGQLFFGAQPFAVFQGYIDAALP